MMIFRGGVFSLGYMLLVTLFPTINKALANELATMPETPNLGDPILSGYHFRITVVEQLGYVDIETDKETGELSFSGYLVDVLKEVSKEHRGNFTYELATPSGFGSKCEGRLNWTKGEGFNSTTEVLDHPESYGIPFQAQYKCGESDVNDRPLSAYSTDMYWSLYYITPERLKVNRFTVPYKPPGKGTLGMMGTATYIYSFDDLVANHSDRPICAFANTAYVDSLRMTFPELTINLVHKPEGIHKALSDGTCDIFVGAYAELSDMVRVYSETGRCQAHGLPIGMIGEPMEFGLNYFSIGVRTDLPNEVLDTLNYWLLALMACFPADPEGICFEDGDGGSLSQLYDGRGGTGFECGYVQFPVLESAGGLHPGVIAAIVVVPVILVLLGSMVYHVYQLKAQEKRMKKRFIQQLARNIDIGESAREIPADKLTEAFKHIGGEDGLISKQDLAQWLNDLHMDFLSESDFDRLWDTMDMEGRGVVEPLDFFAFLSECGPQFKEVHMEYSSLPKIERQKLASRRLSNISAMGEEGVKQMERRNNRRSRLTVQNTRASDSKSGRSLSGSC
ncbi:expressed unknown protein [Seminavis robusta]|uniref:EF-hand domain-containing protein n=1 Tax=Seminavis robusta TaxID=568900 RepID=A0A9N8HPX5_9STRA|nr:expressed unknown protein [Seminavis robusta]|eukprot:Sro1113_g242680.1 n/a (563) ;mRNA; f:22081-23857